MQRSNRNSWLSGLLVLALLVFAGQVWAQQSARIAIEQVDSSMFPQVEAYLSVSDVQGFPVKGLLKENFSVSEDGQPVPDFEVSSVQNIQQPLAFVLLIVATAFYSTATYLEPTLDFETETEPTPTVLLQPTPTPTTGPPTVTSTPRPTRTPRPTETSLPPEVTPTHTPKPVVLPNCPNPITANRFIFCPFTFVYPTISGSVGYS